MKMQQIYFGTSYNLSVVFTVSFTGKNLKAHIYRINKEWLHQPKEHVGYSDYSKLLRTKQYCLT